MTVVCYSLKCQHTTRNVQPLIYTIVQLMTWLLYCYDGQIVANSVSFMCSLNTECITSNMYIEWGKLFHVIDVVHVL